MPKLNFVRLSVLATAIVLAVGLAFLPSAIQADEHAAWVVHDGSCGLTSAASGLAINLGPAEQTGYQKVVTPSGNVRLTCHFAIPSGYWPSSSIVNGGFTCGITTPNGFINTDDTKSVASDDGDAMLRCMFKANS